MTIPGFTADFALHGPGVNRLRTAGIARWTGNAHIQPAIRTKLHSVGKVKKFCQDSGGLFLPKGGTSSTYGCLRDDGTGIVCGGVTKDQKKSCDTF